MKYRAEIDGLRALAVIPVILFHAGFSLFSGGYVGVDVFFVISGYLITTIIMEDIENKRFSLLHFYERRCRRILPALLFVMLVCIPFAWLWLPPVEMRDFAQSVIAVSVFASNIFFWQTSGYFDIATEVKPLLHTWSLAVEEQYYIVFPIFLIFAWRFGKNRVFWMIVVMATISLLLSEWGWHNYPTANFYLAPTRAWELFAGSIAAFIVQKRGVKKNEILSILGFIAIVFSILVYDETTPFPSVYALVPVLGVVLLILFADKDTVMAKILSTKVLVGIGLISYSAYLWHQPLFAFRRIRFTEPTDIEMLVLSAMSIILAIFSWKFVEQPFRNKSKFKRKNIFILAFCGCSAFFVAGVSGHVSNGFSNRIEGWDGLLVDQYSLIQQNAFVEYVPTYCFNDGRRTVEQLRQGDFCIVGQGDLEFAILGDSHSGSIYDAAGDYFKSINKSAIAVGLPFCPPYIPVYGINDECAETMQIAFNYVLSSDQIKTVILVAQWGQYAFGYRPPEKGDNNNMNVIFEQSFALMMETLLKSSKNVIIFHTVPEFTQSAVSWIGQKVLYGGVPSVKLAALSLPSISMSDYNERNFLISEMFKKYDGKVTFIPMDEVFCRSDNCYQYAEDGTLWYSDNSHLTRSGADLAIQRFVTEFEK